MALTSGPSLAKAMGDASVIILVGLERKRYLIHKALLTKQSDYFDRALNGSFKEAEEREIHFEEESPAAFDLLVGWLYQDRIPIVGPLFGNFRDRGSGTSSASMPTLPFAIQSSSTPFGDRQVDTILSDTGEVNSGTWSVPFRAFLEPGVATGLGGSFGGLAVGTVLSDSYQSIVRLSEYHRWSLEELRLADYQRGRIVMGQNVTEVTPTKVEATSDSAFHTEGRIPGIPQCPSLQDLTNEEEKHQEAVLQLCLLAETLCWDTLFNRAMTAYTQGEANLGHRTLRTEHIELIYQRAHDESPCRLFAADAAVTQLCGTVAQTQYIELSREYPAFLQDIFKSLGRNPALSLLDPKKRFKCHYHYHPNSERCAATEEEGLCMGTGELGSFGQHTRAWMDSRVREKPVNPFSAFGSWGAPLTGNEM